MGSPVEERLAAQVGSKGFFGKVVLEAEPLEGQGEVHVEFDATHANRWQTGARFGIDYVLEHVPVKKIFPRGGRIFVSHIVGHPVDTNNVVIAYVSAMALLKALDVQPNKQAQFDEINGVFSFPK